MQVGTCLHFINVQRVSVLGFKRSWDGHQPPKCSQELVVGGVVGNLESLEKDVYIFRNALVGVVGQDDTHAVDVAYDRRDA